MASDETTLKGDNRSETDRDYKKLSSQFNRVVRWAQAAIFWERLWPRLVPPFCTGGIFLSASWAGLWQPLPPEARMAGALTFAAAFLASPFLMKTKSLHVTKKDALKRLDGHIGDPARPAQTLADNVAVASPPVAHALWRAHLEGVWDKWAGQFKAGRPRSDVPRRDPYNIRYAILLCTMLTAAVAGEYRAERLTEAFNWAAPVTVVAPLKVKAWVMPPENIQTPPLYLTEKTQDYTQGGGKLLAHQTSTLTILTFGEETEIFVNGAKVPVQKTILSDGDSQEKSTFQYEIQLTEKDTIVAIKKGPQWHFEVAPDTAPTVRINSIDTPEKDPGRLEVTCIAKDDYGIHEGVLIIERSGAVDPESRPLPSGKLPIFPLSGRDFCKPK